MLLSLHRYPSNSQQARLQPLVVPSCGCVSDTAAFAAGRPTAQLCQGINIWVWVKNRYPGKWKQRPKHVVPWWFDFDPHPYAVKQTTTRCRNLLAPPPPRPKSLRRPGDRAPCCLARGSYRCLLPKDGGSYSKGIESWP